MHLITFFIIIIASHLSHLGSAFQIEPIKLELLDDRFRVSISNDPDIRWVAYNININRDFKAFEAGQFAAVVNVPVQGQWPSEFKRALDDSDLVYIWVAVQYRSVVFRGKQGPISVAAVRRGDLNVIVTPPYSEMTITSASSTPSKMTTTTTTTKKPTISVRGGPNKIETNCYRIVTETSNGVKYCKGDLLFEENFDQLSPQRWINEVRIPTDKGDAEFSFYNGTARVADGTLILPAALYGTERNLLKGTLDLGNRCTSFVFKECHLEAQPPLYLPPIVSARVNSRKSFSFKYGRIEVRAKLPKGDWLVPLILLEPTTPKYGSDHYINGEMRIAFTRGNEQLQVNDTNIDGQRLFGGAVFSTTADLRHQFMANVTLDKVNGINEHFGNQYHNYSMLWSPTEIVLSVDNYVYGKIPTNFKDKKNENAWRMGPENAPVDQMYHITLGLSVGGHGDFPKHTANKPWENLSPKAIVDFYNNHAEWEPTWENPELEVDYVKVWAI